MQNEPPALFTKQPSPYLQISASTVQRALLSISLLNKRDLQSNCVKRRVCSVAPYCKVGYSLHLMIGRHYPVISNERHFKAATCLVLCSSVGATRQAFKIKTKTV